MTQKKTNVLIFLQLVPVPQAKLQILEKTTSFRKTFTRTSPAGHGGAEGRSY